MKMSKHTGQREPESSHSSAVMTFHYTGPAVPVRVSGPFQPNFGGRSTWRLVCLFVSGTWFVCLATETGLSVIVVLINCLGPIRSSRIGQTFTYFGHGTEREKEQLIRHDSGFGSHESGSMIYQIELSIPWLTWPLDKCVILPLVAHIRVTCLVLGPVLIGAHSWWTLTFIKSHNVPAENGWMSCCPLVTRTQPQTIIIESMSKQKESNRYYWQTTEFGNCSTSNVCASQRECLLSQPSIHPSSALDFCSDWFQILTLCTVENSVPNPRPGSHAFPFHIYACIRDLMYDCFHRTRMI